MGLGMGLGQIGGATPEIYIDAARLHSTALSLVNYKIDTDSIARIQKLLPEDRLMQKFLGEAFPEIFSIIQQELCSNQIACHTANAPSFLRILFPDFPERFVATLLSARAESNFELTALLLDTTLEQMRENVNISLWFPDFESRVARYISVFTNDSLSEKVNEVSVAFTSTPPARKEEGESIGVQGRAMLSQLRKAIKAKDGDAVEGLVSKILSQIDDFGRVDSGFLKDFEEVFEKEYASSEEGKSALTQQEPARAPEFGNIESSNTSCTLIEPTLSPKDLEEQATIIIEYCRQLMSNLIVDKEMLTWVLSRVQENKLLHDLVEKKSPGLLAQVINLNMLLQDPFSLDGDASAQ